MKRIFCLALVACMMLGLVACELNLDTLTSSSGTGEIANANGTGSTASGTTSHIPPADTAESPQQTQTPQQTETEQEPTDPTQTTAPLDTTASQPTTSNTPSIEPNKREFSVRSIVQTANANSFVAERDGTVINNAVYQRNETLQTVLGIQINVEETVGDTNNNALYDEMKVLSGMPSYDLITTASYKMVRLAVEGLLHDLASQEFIELHQDYYDDSFNEALNVGGRQYLATGKFSLAWYRYQIVCLYNRTLFEHVNLSNPMETVLEQRWTMEEMMQCANKMYTDLNGNGEFDQDDAYGLFIFVGNSSSQTDGFMSAFGLRVVEKDSNGYFQMAEIDKRAWVDPINRLADLLSSSTGVWSTNTLGNTAIEAKFAAGESGMIVYRMYVVETDNIAMLGRTKEGYGILPLPKADLDQEDYYSFVTDQVLSYGIPNTVTGTDLDDAVIFFESFTAVSYMITTPAYYEKAITKRYVADELSCTMLQIIDSNVVVDPVNVYYGTYFPFTTGSLRPAYDGSKSATAILESTLYSGAFEGKMEQLNDTLQALDNELKKKGM